MRLASALVIVLTACSSGSSALSELEGPGFRVDVPRGWREGSVVGGASTGGSPEFSRSLSPPDGDGASYVLIEVYELEAGEQAIRARVQPLVEDLARDTGGRVVSGPATGSMGGLSSVRYQVAIPREGGGEINATLYFAFEGSTQYYVDCQSTPRFDAEIARGCREIVSSFTRV